MRDDERETNRPSIRTAEARPLAEARAFGKPQFAPEQRYVLLDRVGQGAMGVVFAAWDRELNRKIAIKLVRPERSDPREQARLLREAQALAGLRHENVVLVYDVGTLEGRVFVAMEFIEGPSLRGWCAEQPRPWRDVVRVFLAAGRGLQAAHAAGLVHGDFKPDNVLIDRAGKVRVADFGLARETAPPTDEKGRDAPDLAARAIWMSTAADAMGTPAYMAPELLEGGRADQRSDQYAFAAALFEALFGLLPFEGKTGPELLAAIDRPLARPATNVPGRVWAVVARGLARDPGSRFPSMQALLIELGRDPGAQRKRLGWAAGILLAVGAAQAAAWQLAGRSRLLCKGAEAKLAGVWDDGARARVRRAFATSKSPLATDTTGRVVAALDEYGRKLVASATDACEATQLRGDQSSAVMDLRTACVGQRLEELRAVASVLAAADAQVVSNAVKVARALPDPRACDDVAALLRPVPLPADPAVRARTADIRRNLAQARASFDAGRRSQALPIFQQAVSSAQAVGYPPVEAEALVGLARARVEENMQAAEGLLTRAILRAEAGGAEGLRGAAAAMLGQLVGAQGRAAEARLWLDLALAVAERTRSPKLAADAQQRLMSLAVLAARYDEAKEWGAKALASQQATGALDHGEAASVLMELGSAAEDLGRWDEAEGHFARAVELAERGLGPRHSMTLTARFQLEVMAISRARFRPAIARMRPLLATAESVLLPDSWRLVQYRAALARALLGAREMNEALTLARQAHEKARASLPVESYKNAMRLLHARLLLETGDVSRGESEARAALASLRKEPPAYGLFGVFGWYVVARAAETRGQHQAALIALQEAQRVTDEAGPQRLLEHVECLALRSEVERKLGQDERALATAQQAMDLADGIFDAESMGRVPALLALGQARTDAGLPAEAVPPLERALAILDREQTPASATLHERSALARARQALTSSQAR